MSDPEIKVLIVEDNPDHRAVITQLLASSHSPAFTIASASNVRDAEIILRSGGIGIVLLDLTVEDSAGIATFERISAAAQDVPIVVLSGLADVGLAVQTVQLGAQDYLVKGHVDNNLLLRSVQYAVERKRAQVELRQAYDELEQRVSERTVALREANEALKAEVEERKRAEAQSLESNRQLKEALDQLRAMQAEMVERERLKVLSQMAGGIAHEFNNVLTPVIGFADHLLSHPDVLRDPARARSYIERISEAAHSGTRAIDRVRDFARAEAGEVGPVNVEEIVRSSINLAEPRWRNEAQAAGKTIFVAQNVEDVPDVTGDPARLRELLAQLIFNAVAAIGRRGMISISAARRGGGVAVAVKDDGCGMSDGERLRLLDPRQSASGPNGGITGYGVIHGILERHGGKLEITSSEGRGTSVVIVLPAPADAAAPDMPPPAGAAPSRPLRVLVADDEPMVRDVVCVYLGEDGHSVEVAENGRDALEKFSTSEYDLVLTDRAMPEMNGDQLAIEIKKRKPSVPVVLLTGFGDAMQAEGELPQGVDVIVPKPFTMSILRDALAKVLP